MRLTRPLEMMYLLCKYDVALRTNDVLPLYGKMMCAAGQPVLCDVTLADAAGKTRTLPYPDKELTRLGIDEGSTVVLTADGTLKKA